MTVASLGIGIRTAVGRAQTAADGDVETFQLGLLYNGDQREVIRKHIHIVVRGNSDADLELPGKITILVERVFLFFFIGKLFFIQPDFVIGLCLWQQQIADAGGIGVYFFVDGRL